MAHNWRAPPDLRQLSAKSRLREPEPLAGIEGLEGRVVIRRSVQFVFTMASKRWALEACDPCPLREWRAAGQPSVRCRSLTAESRLAEPAPRWLAAQDELLNDTLQLVDQALNRAL